MILTSKQIIEKKLLKLEHTKGKVSQIGYDLSLQSVNKIEYNSIAENGGRIGKILENKTELTNYTPMAKTQLDGVNGWLLYPGVYDITMWEGCKIPSNLTAFIKQRSSLARNGCFINSPAFDPGFETNFIGTIMKVENTTFFEENCRVAQIYFHTHEEVDQTYNGQFQHDSQRKSL